jgi:MFS family permease
MERTRLTFGTVVAGYFLVMFAVSPVSVVLPTMAADLGVGVEQASWVMTAYLLPLTACLLPAGRLGDMLGHRRLFGAGIALGALSALLAGLAPSLEVLLAARALQGIGAALVSATSLPIITATVSDARRGRAVGLVTMSSSTGAMAGTALAPLFVHYLDWRWAFFSAAATGLAALVPALLLGPDARGAEAASGRRPALRTLDWPGAVLLLLTLSVASLSLNHFHEGPETFQDGWQWHVPMHAATLALLAMFVAVELRMPAPLVQLRQLTNGLFTTAVGANLVLHMTMMMAVFSTPFLVQRGLALGPVETGVLLTTMQACTTGMTLVGGWLYDRTRSPWWCPAAMAMVASGLTLLGLAGESLDYARTFAIVLWMGIGSGCFMTTNNTRIMSALAPEHRGFASGMLETSRQYGHTLGVAVAATGLAPALAAGAALAAAGNAGPDPAVRAGFGTAALIMAGIAWIGVALAAYPLYPLKRLLERAPALSPAAGARPALAESSR